ncbi:hypothetical protein BS78_08G017000 [Paspalum vaginatum]|nr:hypothetical protein BS78_08G017000 [Paspalum vaginatum]
MPLLSDSDPCMQPASSYSSSSSSSRSARISASAMDRISQWVSSQSHEIPADLTVRVGDSVFPLHKAVMVPRCGYIRRAVAAAAANDTDDPAAAVELDLSALPGGAGAFEKAARCCYGAADFEATARDAAALRCAAAFLDAADLARRAEEFLARSALRTLPGAVAVLRSCEALLPAAEELGVARRAADAVALALCASEAPASPGQWAAELAPASFRRVAAALRCRGAGPEVVAAEAGAYAELALAEVLAGPRGCAPHRALIEAVVDALPPAADAPLPAALLCRLLHAAVAAGAAAETCRDLELRVAAVLDQATPGDLLRVAGERARNADTVRRVIAAFVERQEAQAKAPEEGGRGSVSGGADQPGAGALEKVARTVDEVAAEIAAEAALPVSKFVGVAGAVPKDARPSHDCLYRAVDVYLKAHPALDEIEREKVCSVMDPLRLSHHARLHASQNKRLPLQAVLSALYYDQLKLRSGAGDEDDGGWETRSAAGRARAQARADAALARENEALRLELVRTRAYVSSTARAPTQQHQHSKGSGSRTTTTPAPAAKKASFLGSVSRTLSRLNPFRGGGWAKDTASIADGSHDNAMHVVRPKRRRFSIG